MGRIEKKLILKLVQYEEWIDDDGLTQQAGLSERKREVFDFRSDDMSRDYAEITEGRWDELIERVLEVMKELEHVLT